MHYLCIKLCMFVNVQSGIGKSVTQHLLNNPSTLCLFFSLTRARRPDGAVSKPRSLAVAVVVELRF